MATKDSMGKSTENLDEAAGAAPSERFLDEVDTTQFGTTDEESEDESAKEGETARDGEVDDS
jgi:hypothetical protein